MKHLFTLRGFLRPALFGTCALAALALPGSQTLQSMQESWLTRDEFRARDGSPLKLHEHRYTDVEIVPECRAMAASANARTAAYASLATQQSGTGSPRSAARD